MTSHSSFWPLPAMPAMPRISPARIGIKGDIVQGGDCPRRSAHGEVHHLKPIFRPAPRAGRSISSIDGHGPPSISVSSSWSGAAGIHCTDSYSPLRRIATRSEMESTSLSLWVMMMIGLPVLLHLAQSSEAAFRVSWGVSTAVGSSRIRMSAPRYSTLRISTVCFSETRHGVNRLLRIGLQAHSVRHSSITFSPQHLRRSAYAPGSAQHRCSPLAEKTSTSLKCWWIMPMPQSKASRGERMAAGCPWIRISP